MEDSCYPGAKLRANLARSGFASSLTAHFERIRSVVMGARVNIGFATARFAADAERRHMGLGSRRLR